MCSADYDISVGLRLHCWQLKIIVGLVVVVVADGDYSWPPKTNTSSNATRASKAPNSTRLDLMMALKWAPARVRETFVQIAFAWRLQL